MENNQQQILSEIKTKIHSIREQLEQLDIKMAQWQQMVSPETIDISLDDEMQEVSVVTLPDLPEMVEIDLPEEPLEELSVVPEMEDVALEPEEPVLMMPEPEPDQGPATVHEVAQSAASASAVIDVMASRQAWRTDMPGSPVKDVRGAIALVDRVLFINGLFGTDPMAFQETLTAINQMDSLDSAVEYLVQGHPEWDFESEIVYRFMMAVRRKLS